MVYTLDDVAVFDQTVSVAQVLLQFDQPLYVQNVLVCPFEERQQACAAALPARPCQQCDFSRADTCSSSCCTDAGERANWCGQTARHQRLAVNGPPEAVALLAGETAHFRFFVDASLACRPLHVSLHLDYGEITSALDLVAEPDPFDARPGWGRDTFWGPGMASFELCPAWDGRYRLGTYGLSVAATTDAAFRLRIVVEQPRQPTAPTQQQCSAAPADLMAAGAVCLENGATWLGSVDAPAKQTFVLPVPPGQCAVSAAYVSGEPDTDTDVDLYCLSPTPATAGLTTAALLARYLVGSDRLTLATCPDDDDRAFIVCVADVLAAGSYVFVWSSGGVLEQLPLVASSADSDVWASGIANYDLTLGTGLSMLRAVDLAADDTPLALQGFCASWKGTCQSDWATAASRVPLPFWPLPSWSLSPDAFLQLRLDDGLQALSRAQQLPGALLLTVNLDVAPLDQLLQRASVVLFNVANAAGEAPALPNNGVGYSSADNMVRGFATVAMSSLRTVDAATAACLPRQLHTAARLGAAAVSDLRAVDSDTPVAFIEQRSYDLMQIAALSAFQGCLAALTETLLTPAVRDVLLVDQHVCQLATDDPNWLLDPCCNDELLPVACCLPANVTVEQTAYTAVDAAQVNATCRHGDCAANYLAELQLALSSVDSVCNFAVWRADVAYRVQREIERTVVACRQRVGLGVDFRGVFCARDADCAAYSGATHCDLAAQRCTLLPRADVESLYLACYVDTLDAYTETWLRTELGIADSVQRQSPQFVDALRAAATVQDCVGDTLLDEQPLRSVYRPEPDVPVPYYCLSTSCFGPAETSTCPECSLPAWQLDAPSNCTATPDLCLIAAPAPCPASTSHCVYCPEAGDAPSQQCLPHPTIASADACQQAAACVLPDGSVLFDLSADQCAAQQASCNVDCPGASCRSWHNAPGACLLPAVTAPDACTGQWLSGACFADSVDDSDACAAVGGQWHTCDAASSSVCSGGGAPNAVDLYLLCYEDMWRPCTSRAECEASGYCSDREVTVALRYDDTNSSYSVQFGACFTSGFYQDWVPAPVSFCQTRPGTRRTVNGCRELLVDAPELCGPGAVYDSDYQVTVWKHWLAPALSQADCLAAVPGRVGCRQTERLGTELRYQWLPDAQQCSACLGVFEPAFAWTPGTWTAGGVLRPLQWRAQAPLVDVAWRPALSFEQTEQWTRTAQQQRLSFGAASEVLCRYELLSTPLLPLTCDCLADTAQRWRGCYRTGAIALPLAIGALCQGQSFIIANTFGSVAADSSSVRAGCAQVAIALVPGSFFAPYVLPQSVSFDVAELQSSRSTTYVVNAHGATVGVVAGDGVELQPRPYRTLDHLRVCLYWSNASSSSDWPVPDLGRWDGDGTVLPQGLTVDEFDAATGYGCCLVTAANGLGAADFVAYVPVYRAADSQWRAATNDPYSSTSLALIYTLAALYCPVLLVAGVYLVSAARSGAQRLLSFPTGAVSTMAVLCVFRIVYLFALPSQVIYEHTLANFVVFELPTFLYFSAVSFLLGAYLAIGAQKGIPRSQARSQWLVLALLNSVVWCLFIAVLVAVAVIGSQPTTNPSACPGIVPGSESSTNSQLRALRLAYQSIVIALDFLLFVGFLVSLVLLITKQQAASFWHKAVRAFTSTGGRTYRTASIISVAYFVRCILFIVILAVDFTSTIYMFLTLFFTEVLPIFLVIVHFRLFTESIKKISASSGSLTRSAGSRGTQRTSSTSSKPASALSTVE